jgi:hypothetical protein
MLDKSHIRTSDLSAYLNRFASEAQRHLVVAAPFIRRIPLEMLLSNVRASNVLVLTTWNTNDALRKVSEASIYPFLKSRGWELRLIPRLHAKLVVTDLRTAVVTTANITEAGLGPAQPSNIECAVRVNQLTEADQRWVLRLAMQSTLVTDTLYGAFTKYVESIPNTSSATNKEFDLTAFFTGDWPSFPATRSPRLLVSRLRSLRNFGVICFDEQALRELLDDISLFSLPTSAPTTELLAILRESFFALPSMVRFQSFLKRGRYFGEIKAWVASEMNDGTPLTKEHRTRIVQTLMAWFVELRQKDYRVIRPHHSQRLVSLRLARTLS